jgi:hypothetical protein
MSLSELEAAVAAAGVVNNIEQWFIAPASVEKGIADIKTLQEQRARRDASRPDMTGHDGTEIEPSKSQDMSSHDATRRDMTGYVAAEISRIADPDVSGHDGTRPDMSGRNEQEKGSPTQSETAGRLALLEMQIEEKNKQLVDKDDQIEFLQDELKDRRDQIRGMKEIISEQKTLLETLVTPIFKALAKSVEGGSLTAGPVKTASVDVTPAKEPMDAVTP